MRTSFFFFILVSAILTITGCKKDTGIPITNNSPISPLALTNNEAIWAMAGDDVFIFLPVDSCELKGSSSIHRNSFARYMWRKTSGPTSYSINNPDSLSTSVNNLTEGVYEFELTVTDKDGFEAVSKVSVYVLNRSAKEITIKNKLWILDDWTRGFYVYIFVPNIYRIIPVGSDFKIFIRRDNSSVGVEAIQSNLPLYLNAQYTFSISRSDASVYANYYLTVYANYNVEGKADIVIVF